PRPAASPRGPGLLSVRHFQCFNVLARPRPALPRSARAASWWESGCKGSGFFFICKGAGGFFFGF
ncbi:hypothetical protein NP234_24220, partial [Salmonella enterica]|nr:hypothetical protein [Salmonella enterica]